MKLNKLRLMVGRLFKTSTVILLATVLAFSSVLMSSCKPNSVDVTPVVEKTSIDLSEYTIIRSSKADLDTIELIGNLKVNIDDKTAMSIKISDDWVRDESDIDSTAKEILVGETNRPETTMAEEKISEGSYIVELSGNKIVICASDDNILEYAVQYFITEFVDKIESGSVVLFDKDYSHISEPLTMLALTEGNFSKYTIVRSDDASEYLTGIVADFKITLMSVTGVGQQYITTDYLSTGKEHDSNKYDILIGNTNYSETAQVKQTLGADEYTIAVVGNKIVICGWNDTTTALAVAKFVNILNTSKSVDITKGETFSILYIEPIVYTTNLWLCDFPQYSHGVKTGIFDCNDGSLLYYYTNTTRNDYNDYCTSLVTAGYTKLAENEFNSNAAATFNKDSIRIHVYFTDYEKTVRVISEPNNTTLPLTNLSVTKTAEPTVTQLALNYEATGGSTNGMGYIIRLEDGTFIVYDGGFEDDAETLYSELCSQNTNGGKPVISAWIFTHMHPDHYKCFDSFSESYANDVILKNVIMNVPSATTHSSSNGYTDFYTSGKFTQDLNKFASTNFIKAHTGEVFYFGNAKIEILYTYEDLFPKTYDTYNNTSVVTRITIAGQKLLFLGDVQTMGSDIICDMYGSTLKSDIVQIAHHGSPSGSTIELYDFVDADIAFFPGSSSRYSENKDLTVNAYVIQMVKKVFVADGVTLTLKLPYYYD